MATYTVNPAAVRRTTELIDSRQYVLDSDWGKVQPRADAQNAYLEKHSWEEYAACRTALIACVYRASEWRHKDIEIAAHDLLQHLDQVTGWRGAPLARLRSVSSEMGAGMARVVVDVMLKPEILDPQGKAVHGALPRLGFEGVTDVRQGKRFELELDGDATPERLERVRALAETLLSNPVIEDFSVRVDNERQR